MERQTEETINAEIQGIREQYRLLGLAGVVRAINERSAKDKSKSSLYLLTDRNYLPLAGNLVQWPEVKTDESGWIEFALDDDKTGQLAKARRFLLVGNFHLLVGRNVSEQKKIENLIIDSLGWGVGITIILGLLGGLFMSKSMLRRLDVINRASREIIAGGLDKRIPKKGTEDEFDQLIENLNDMLDKIERLMNGIRQVSDNIAHDLRSPLNRLRSRLEMALLGQKDTKEYRLAIEQTIEETDKILATFSALLKIAQIESGTRRDEMHDVDLSILAGDIADYYEPLAEANRLAFETNLKSKVTVHGDRHLLSQAIANLLDNAIKYTPEGGRISLALENGPKGTELIIADSGPGVPVHEREKVLQRFYRLETNRNTPGNGLGLSLVAAVAAMHNASLRLADNDPGLMVTITFP